MSRWIAEFDINEEIEAYGKNHVRSKEGHEDKRSGGGRKNWE